MKYLKVCPITGIDETRILLASHIKPWKTDEKNRLNPHNGLCLNSIHDKAFDRGFLTITPDYKVKVSKFFEEVKNDNSISDLFL